MLPIMFLVFIGVSERDQKTANRAYLEYIREYVGTDGFAVAVAATTDRIYVKRVGLMLQCADTVAPGCTRRGTRQVDGVTVALIELSMEGSRQREAIIRHEMRHAVAMLLGRDDWRIVGHGVER